MAWSNSKNVKDWQESIRERQDKAFDLYAEMLINKIENAKKMEWKKPWFTEGQLAWPKALYGKPYHGMNALMLTLHCEQEGYRIPVFATRERIFGMNFQKDANGDRFPLLDDDGNKLPFVHVSKGEHSFPVFLSQVNVVHKESKERIKWADYLNLDAEEKKNYNVFHNPRVYYVFNVDQTNLREARPELYAKLEEENVPKKLDVAGPVYKFDPLDVIVNQNLWICPIKPQYQDSAYYSLHRDEIVIPMKEQFAALGKPEAYYGTMLHEMVHSTGAPHQYDRLKPSVDREAYAREELVAELGAAITSCRYGIGKFIKDDSIPYVQGWLDALHEKPEFIRTVLKDVRLATAAIDVRIDSVRQVYLGENAVQEAHSDIDTIQDQADDDQVELKQLKEEQQKYSGGFRL